VDDVSHEKGAAYRTGGGADEVMRGVYGIFT